MNLLSKLSKVLGAAIVVIAILGSSGSCMAQIPDVSHIDAMITPYYMPDGPVINVGQFSAGLATTDEKTFLATIHEMKRSWDKLSFTELCTGAICLYNWGYRWESVYWFYTGGYRGLLFDKLVDPSKMGGIGDIAFELYHAVGAFHGTVGQYFNSFAGGDIKRLTECLQRVLDVSTSIPDMQKIYPNVAFVDSTKWQAANSEVVDGLKQLIVTYSSPENADEIAKRRASLGTNTQFGSLINKEFPAE